jgi:hypothetical protein
MVCLKSGEFVFYCVRHRQWRFGEVQGLGCIFWRIHVIQPYNCRMSLRLLPRAVRRCVTAGGAVMRSAAVPSLCACSTSADSGDASERNIRAFRIQRPCTQARPLSGAPDEDLGSACSGKAAPSNERDFVSPATEAWRGAASNMPGLSDGPVNGFPHLRPAAECGDEPWSPSPKANCPEWWRSSSTTPQSTPESVSPCGLRQARNRSKNPSTPAA